MKQKSMTALVSAFARAYHAQHNEVKIFDDSVARRILTDIEYDQIAISMAQGISFFNPVFQGTQEMALRWVVDNQLSPTPLGRAAFAEKALETAVTIGARQYLILGAGYDTFACRQPDWAQKLHIFELDHPATAQDKRKRLFSARLAAAENVHYLAVDFTQEKWWYVLAQNTAFHSDVISVCSILGVTYYLSENTFKTLLTALYTLLPEGSSLVFDYPDENNYTAQAGERAKKQTMLAGAADEAMRASYSCAKMEAMLADCGFLLYEHLTPQEMTAQYFSAYNKANPNHLMAAFDNVNYCLAVKKTSCFLTDFNAFQRQRKEKPSIK